MNRYFTRKIRAVNSWLLTVGNEGQFNANCKLPIVNCQLPTDMVSTLTQKEFQLFCDLIYAESGIKLNSSKRNLVQSRLQKRLRQRNINSFTDYYHLVTNDQSREEMVHLIDCISTNKTYFFRENKHFDLLDNQILPGLIKGGRGGRGNKIRIWCAACSSGEEAYTIAMLLYNKIAVRGDIDGKILATDISTRVLRKAINGVYDKEQVKDTPANLLNKFFTRFNDGKEKFYKIKDCARKLVTYRKFNLLHLDSMSNSMFDIIFCRNVMIYFDYETRYRLVKKFYEMLSPGGFFFLSHSENLSGRDHGFRSVQPAVYQKL